MKARSPHDFVRPTEYARLRSGLSIEEVGDELGVDPSLISEIEMGDYLSSLPVRFGLRLSQLLDVPMAELVTDEPALPPNENWKILHSMLLRSSNLTLSADEIIARTSWSDLELTRAKRALRLRLVGSGCEVAEPEPHVFRIRPTHRDPLKETEADGSSPSEEVETSRALWDLLQGRSSERHFLDRYREILDEMTEEGAVERFRGEYFPSESLIKILGVDTAPVDAIFRLRATDPRDSPMLTCAADTRTENDDKTAESAESHSPSATIDFTTCHSLPEIQRDSADGYA